MSKATFYEHFANKEECIIALFDAAVETLLHNMRDAVARHAEADPQTRVRTDAAGFPRHARQLPRGVADAARGDRRRRPAGDGAA